MQAQLHMHALKLVSSARINQQLWCQMTRVHMHDGYWACSAPAIASIARRSTSPALLEVEARTGPLWILWKGRTERFVEERSAWQDSVTLLPRPADSPVCTDACELSMLPTIPSERCQMQRFQACSVNQS